MHLLFVCTGNVCRSPTAERLAVAYSERFALTGLTVASAGTQAMINHPIHHEAAVVLGRLGGDSSGFAARQLTSRIASDADLVLTMTGAHRDAVLELAPRQLHRTFTMVEAARLSSEHDVCSVADLAACRPQLDTRGLADVPDPIGRGESFFSVVGAQIAELLPPIMKLCKAD